MFANPYKWLIGAIAAVALTFSGVTPAAAMALYVTVGTGGSTLSLEVEASDSVENIKAKIQDRIEVPPDQQRLTYTSPTPPNNIVTLADGRTLSDYNIQGNATIVYTRIQNIACSGGGTFLVTNNVLNDNNGCLGSVVIPANVKSVGNSAFLDATLTSVTFEPGSQLTSLDFQAFFATSLDSIVLPEGLRTIGEKAFFRTTLTSIAIPSSVTSIGDSAFYDSETLTSLTFASGSQLTTIAGWAFAHQRLTSVNLPGSVTTIGTNAFRYNPGLTSVTMNSNAPTVGADAFVVPADGAKVRMLDTFTGYGNQGALWYGLVIDKISTAVAPAAPANVTGLVTGTSAVVTWSASAGATSYTVTSGTGGPSCVATTALSCTLEGLVLGQSYVFFVVALNGSATSSAGQSAQVLVPIPTVVVTAPKLLKISGFSATSVSLTKSMKTKIKAFIKSGAGYTKLSCAGDVKGVRKSSAQVRLAVARAKAVCSYAKTVSGSLVAKSTGKQSTFKGADSRFVRLTLTK